MRASLSSMRFDPLYVQRLDRNELRHLRARLLRIVVHGSVSARRLCRCTSHPVADPHLHDHPSLSLVVHSVPRRPRVSLQRSRWRNVLTGAGRQRPLHMCVPSSFPSRQPPPCCLCCFLWTVQPNRTQPSPFLSRLRLQAIRATRATRASIRTKTPAPLVSAQSPCLVLFAAVCLFAESL